ncbi:hypothetical protein EZS27_008661 [termite gut metagenome]|uniref:Uncharacterized protein n=1 Tax=termite gut metagenome TaxID=433724 RepID=A0A5J4SC41_9ZZZZ
METKKVIFRKNSKLVNQILEKIYKEIDEYDEKEFEFILYQTRNFKYDSNDKENSQLIQDNFDSFQTALYDSDTEKRNLIDGIGYALPLGGKRVLRVNCLNKKAV